MMFVSIFEFVPQVFLNNRIKITEGWSIIYTIMNLIRAIFCIFLIILMAYSTKDLKIVGSFLL